jgi:predicted alpha/beta-fold hydrolase
MSRFRIYATLIAGAIGGPSASLTMPRGLPSSLANPTAAYPATIGPGAAQSIYCHPRSRLASAALAECAGLSAEGAYTAPMGWGWDGHAQTILAALFRATPAVEYTRELIATPDGGTLALDVYSRRRGGRWAGRRSGRALVSAESSAQGERAPINRRPFVLLTAGLGGGSDNAYVRSMAVAAADSGYHVAVLNMRGQGGSPLTSPRFFSAHRGSTDDLRLAIAHARAHDHLAAHAPAVTAVGFSVGAAVVVNALAEQEGEGEGLGEGEVKGISSDSRIDAAVALACPHDLAATDASLSSGLSRAYAWSITRSLLTNFKTANAAELFSRARREGGGAIAAWDGRAMDVDVEALLRSSSVRDIDETLTSNCFGYASADDYYERSSPAQRLGSVRVPLLLVNAADDPLVPAHSLPYEAARRSEHVVLAVTAHGGHLGWCDGAWPFGRATWCERTACGFLDAAFAHAADARPTAEAMGRRQGEVGAREASPAAGADVPWPETVAALSHAG